jgi:hypothetical protein
MKQQIIEWKWTKGENYERSKRLAKESIDENLTKVIEQTAYESSLNHDESSWDLVNNLNNGFINFNKREDTDKKLAERQMMSQINMNPYLTNNDYVNDISIRDSFLKPLSTNTERQQNIENNYN